MPKDSFLLGIKAKSSNNSSHNNSSTKNWDINFSCIHLLVLTLVHQLCHKSSYVISVLKILPFSTEMAQSTTEHLKLYSKTNKGKSNCINHIDQPSRGLHVSFAENVENWEHVASHKKLCIFCRSNHRRFCLIYSECRSLMCGGVEEIFLSPSVVGWLWLAARCPLLHAVTLSKTGGENAMENLVDRIKNKEVTHQLPSKTNETRLVKILI